MMASSLGITCSKRCELLLAFSYLLAREDLLSIAQRIKNDAHGSAFLLAKALLALPEKKARIFVVQTLAEAEFSTKLLSGFSNEESF